MLDVRGDRPAAGTRRLPTADQDGRAQADHPDLGDRRLVLLGRAMGLRDRIAGWFGLDDNLADYVAQARNVYSDPVTIDPHGAVHRRRLQGHRRRPARDRRGAADDVRPRPLRPPHPARPRHPRGRPGPRVRRPDGRQLDPGRPGDLPHRRPDGRCRRHPLHDAIGSTRQNAGFILGVKAFTAAVMGGIGNLRGALLGGLVLGVMENWGSACSAPSGRTSSRSSCWS